MTGLNALLIAGTDTEVGKTVLTSALAAYWQTHRQLNTLGILKPLQAGPGDRELYHRLFLPEDSLDTINPQYFEAPLAAPLAAAQENAVVDLEAMWQSLLAQCQQHNWVLVEGAGGLGSPVTAEMTVADLAAAWHLPVVLVVPVKLGAITQAVANVALARQTRLELRGIVLNCPQPRTPTEIIQWAPIGLIESLTQVPVLGCLPHVQNPEDTAALAAIAADLTLELMLPPPVAA
ncbi:ATP-dependent dethiobiotin synthetase BioD [filamentous cyanobacterium CCP5]|nr:ATP-dependent dethiobiotin synthetase BioD [filamentous cyanobacterium CCP5]